MRSLLVMATVLVATLVSAAEPQQIIIWRITDPGDYVVSGSQIVAYKPGGPVVPPVDPPVVPDDLSKVTADLIKVMPASDARNKNAIALAGTLKLLADQAKERQLSSDVIVKVYSPLMAVAVPDDDWKYIHAAILAGLKGCPSPAVCASTLEQYAAGAMSTVPVKGDKEKFRGTSSDEIAAAAEEYGFDWSALLKLLLPLLLALLEQWLSFSQFIAVALLC